LRARIRCDCDFNQADDGILELLDDRTEGNMSKRVYTTLGLFVLFAICGVAQTGADKRIIEVEVNYTGSGTVNASHKIHVALWDSADMSGGPPVAVKSLDAKKGTVVFSDVQKGPAYVSTAYDPTGAWDAQSPPPSGSSLGMYSKNPPNPQPIDVTAGRPVKVTITFDDSVKVP
jgi:hypothetical protein